MKSLNLAKMLVKQEFLFLFLFLFLPQKNFYAYYGVFIFVLIFIILLNKKYISFYRKNLQIFTVFIIFILTFLLYKVLLYENIFDIKELLKIVLFFLIYITTLSLQKINLEQLAKWFFIYISIDFLVSIAQFIHLDFFVLDYIQNIYNAEKHIAISLSYISSRTLGLSPGPGQHAVFSLLIFIFLITSSIFGVSRKYKYFGSLIAFFSLMLSQSKTVILVSLVTFISLSFFIFLYKNRKYKVYLFLIIITIVSLFIYNFENLMIIFEQLRRLQNVGLETSSMIQRFEMWNNMYEPILNSNIFYFLFGAGRSYLTYMDVHNTFFDSDYVYMFVNYGFVGLLIYILYIFYFLTRYTFIFHKIPLLMKILYIMILSGTIIGLSLSFIIDIKVLSLFAILYALKSKIGNEK